MERYLQQVVTGFIDGLSASQKPALSREVPDVVRKPMHKPFEVVLELSNEPLSALAQEAARQEIPVAQLVEHALFLYLSEQDRASQPVRRVDLAQGSRRLVPNRRFK